jgi:hypothetical protein
MEIRITDFRQCITRPRIERGPAFCTGSVPSKGVQRNQALPGVCVPTEAVEFLAAKMKEPVWKLNLNSTKHTCE